MDFEKGDQKLLFAVAKALKGPLLAPIPARLALIGFTISQPLLVNRLLNYLSEPKTPENINVGYGIIAAYGVVYIGIAVCISPVEKFSDANQHIIDIYRLLLAWDLPILDYD